MNKMSEAEIKVQDFISYVRFNEQPKYTEKDWLLAIETILDLYNNQKQQLTELQAIEEEHRKENGELKKENEKLNAEVIENICYRVDTEVFEEMREELKQEKEKNKELLKDNNVLNRLVYFNKNITFPYEIELTSTNEFVSKDKIRSKLEYATKMVKFYTTNEPDHVLIPIYNEVIKVCKELLEEK